MEFFCSNAYDQNYLAPNRSIPIKERPKWRFVVKRFYKEIQLALDAGNHPISCVNELEKLYKVLTYSCKWHLFSAYDSFESIGIEQNEFFLRIVTLYRNHKNLDDFIRDSIRLIIDNQLNRYTLYSNLIDGFIAQCYTTDLLKLCLQQSEITRNDVLQEPDEETGLFSSINRNKNVLSYEKRKKLNNLAKIGFKAKIKLFKYDAAIAYLKQHHTEKDLEVKLYILVSLLFRLQLKDYIMHEIENSKSIKPREALLNLLAYIKKNNDLSEYI